MVCPANKVQIVSVWGRKGGKVGIRIRMKRKKRKEEKKREKKVKMRKESKGS